MKRLLLFLFATAAIAQQNAVLLPWTPQQFTNTNGTILVSGKVCTYLAGTSTGTASFTDATASVQNAIPPNAVLLDSTGRPTSGGIWLTPNKAYKIVTLTAGSDGTCNTGVVVKTQDNVGVSASTTTNNTFSGTNTFTGTTTVTGLFQCANFENTRCVDPANSAAWSGTDVCAWITSAQANLPSTGGTVKVADGTYAACAGGFTVGSATKPVSIYLGVGGGGSGNTLITVNAQIALACSSCQLTGIAGSSTTIFQGASFPANTPVIQIGTGTAVTAATVNYIRVDCNGATTSIGYEDANGLDFTGFTWDIASGCTKYGFWYEGTGLTTGFASIGEKLWSTHTGTATIDFYIHGVNNWRGNYITSVARTTDVVPTGIIIDNGSATIENVHCEHDTVCLDIGPTTATILYAKNLLGNPDSTTVAKIENTASNRVNLFEVVANGSTNSIQDALVGEPVITDSYVTHYEVLPGPVAILEKADGKFTQFGATPESRLATANNSIDGRMGILSGGSLGLGIGTGTQTIVDLFSNNAIGASVEWNGTNSNFKNLTYMRYGETTAPAGIAGSDVCYADSTLHALKCSYNNGTFFQIPQVITATSAAFATATTAGTCVQNTTAVTNAATTMAVSVSPVSTPGIGAVWSGFVSSPGNVTINECAVAASAGGSIAFNIRVTP